MESNFRSIGEYEIVKDIDTEILENCLNAYYFLFNITQTNAGGTDFIKNIQLILINVNVNLRVK